MSDQLLPDFDGPRNADLAPASPKRSRRKPAKKAKRAAPAPKSAKRVAKKRRVRKTASILLATRPNEPLLTSKEFDVTLQVFRLLGEFDPQIRKRMLARLQGAL